MGADTLTYQLEPLVWDTQHFGIPMGRVTFPPAPRGEPEATTVKAALAEAKQQRPRFQQLMCRAAMRDIALIHALETEGFRLMDTLVTMALDFREPLPSPPGGGFYAAEIRPATPDDAVSMMAIAQNAFADRQLWLDRFHADPWLNQEGRADAVYVQWAKNSVAPATSEHAMADCTFVAEPKGGRVTGFITCLRARGAEPAKVPLNAVDAVARQHGVYRALVYRALTWFREQGEPIVTIRTSVASVAVQRTWIRLGAVPTQVEHTFHWWA